MNALLGDWDTPFGLPPFGAFGDADFGAAFDAALDEARANVDRIAADPEPASFANTVEALERSGRALGQVTACSSTSRPPTPTTRCEALQRDLSPRLAAHHSETMMNAALFARIDALLEGRDGLGLSAEEERVLTLYHRGFVRAGARLEGAERERMTADQGAARGPGDAVLAERAGRREGLDACRSAEADLEGLPDFVVAARRGRRARRRARAGRW